MTGKQLPASAFVPIFRKPEGPKSPAENRSLFNALMKARRARAGSEPT
jgi:hypothetical protein